MKKLDLEKSPFMIGIPWSNDPEKVDYKKIFSDYFFLDLYDRGKVVDKFFCDVRAPMYATVKSDNTKFDQPDDEDPDHLISVLYISYNNHTCLTLYCLCSIILVEAVHQSYDCRSSRGRQWR